MPKIPVQPQAQILNAGSPVPIAGTTDARIQGESIAAFGKGLASFADAREKTRNMLYEVQKKEATAMLTDIVKTHEAQALGQINDSPGPLGDDVRKQFVENLQNDISSLGSTIEHPLFKREWEAESKIHVQAFADTIAQKNWGKEVEFIGKSTQRTASIFVDRAAKNPLQRDEMILRAQETYDSVSDDIILPVYKREEKAKMTERVDKAIVEEYKRKGQFDAARAHIDKYPASFADVDKVQDTVDKEELKYLQQERATRKYEDYDATQKRKDAQRLNDAMLGQKFFDPATSVEEKRQIREKVDLYSTVGLVSPGFKAAITNAATKGDDKASKKSYVDIYSAALRDKIPFAVSEMKVIEAMSKKDGFEAGWMSSQDGIALLSKLKALESNPDKKALIRRYEMEVKAGWTKNMLESLNGQEYQTQQADAVIMYHDLLDRGYSEPAAADEARRIYGRGELVPIRKRADPEIVRDLPAIEKELKNALPALKAAEASGNKAEVKRINERVKLLKTMREENIKSNKFRQPIEAPKPDKPKENGILDFFNFGVKR